LWPHVKRPSEVHGYVAVILFIDRFHLFLIS
jgi:hypothetical protein